MTDEYRALMRHIGVLRGLAQAAGMGELNREALEAEIAALSSQADKYRPSDSASHPQGEDTEGG